MLLLKILDPNLDWITKIIGPSILKKSTNFGLSLIQYNLHLYVYVYVYIRGGP
jgi:hypothetical protein